MSLLELKDLHVTISGVEILRGVSVSVEPGQTIGIVGESGCGKSMTGLAIMGMLPPSAEKPKGQILLEGKNLLDISPRDWLEIRGQEIAMVMQDPFTSLNPMMRVGDQTSQLSWGNIERLIEGRTHYLIFYSGDEKMYPFIPKRAFSLQASEARLKRIFEERDIPVR